MGILITVLVVGVALWFIYRILQAVLPRKWISRLPGLKPRKVTEKCSVCKDVLNPAQITALRQGRRRCAEMQRCPYQRNKWLN